MIFASVFYRLPFRPLLLLVAPALAACSVFMPTRTADLELLYVSGGDAPTVTAIRFYHPDTLEIASLGHRSKRKRLPQQDAEAISSLLQNDELERELIEQRDLGTAVTPVDHAEYIRVEAHGIVLQKLFNKLPVRSKEMIFVVDAIARRTMPKTAEDLLFVKPPTRN